MVDEDELDYLETPTNQTLDNLPCSCPSSTVRPTLSSTPPPAPSAPPSRSSSPSRWFPTQSFAWKGLRFRCWGEPASLAMSLPSLFSGSPHCVSVCDQPLHLHQHHRRSFHREGFPDPLPVERLMMRECRWSTNTSQESRDAILIQPVARRALRH